MFSYVYVMSCYVFCAELPVTFINVYLISVLFASFHSFPFSCFESLKSDFLPHVVRKQFSKRKKKKPQEEFIYIDDFKNENSTRDKKGILRTFEYICI